MHFWPYGWNYDHEGSADRNIGMVGALRKDMGLSDDTTTPPLHLTKPAEFYRMVPVSQFSTVSSSSSATADVGRRHIEVTSDEGLATIKAEEGQIKIVTASVKITIEGERILLNAAEIGKLPASANKISVKVADGQITITADDAPVPTAQPQK
jgi:hypothetical protein